MKKIMFVFALGLLLSGGDLFIFAKETSHDSKSGLKRWSISLSLATTSSGPAEDIEKAMVASGFNETTYNFFRQGNIQHPFSRTGFDWFNRYSLMISAHYLLGPHFSVGVIVSESDIGRTHGACEGCLLFIHYGVTTCAPVISGQAYGFRISIGPALYVVKSAQDQGINQQANKIGFLLDFGLTFPEKSRFFVELKGQYRLVGETIIGPYEEKSLWDDVSSTFPAAKVNYNHWFLGGGIGFRF